MNPRKQYLERLAMVIRHLHKCDCEHVQTVPVTETFRGETAWQGDVEVFALKAIQRPNAPMDGLTANLSSS